MRNLIEAEAQCAVVQTLLARVNRDESSPLFRSPVLRRAYAWYHISRHDSVTAGVVFTTARSICPWAKVWLTSCAGSRMSALNTRGSIFMAGCFPACLSQLKAGPCRLESYESRQPTHLHAYCNHTVPSHSMDSSGSPWLHLSILSATQSKLHMLLTKLFSCPGSVPLCCCCMT